MILHNRIFKQKEIVWLIALNLVSISVYFGVVFSLGFPEKLHETIFSSVDSKQYMEMGEWLFGNPSAKCSDTRPFLYPVLIKVFSFFGNNLGIWLLHFCCWILSVNLIFLSLKKTLNNFWAFTGAVAMLDNWSYIAYTMHALTEVVTIFLLSCFVWFAVHWHKRFAESKFWWHLIFISGLLTVVKPLFVVTLYIVLICFFVVQMRKREMIKWTSFFLLLISLLPVFIQMTIIKSQFGIIGISSIGESAFRYYYFGEFFAEKNQIPFPIEGGASEKNIDYIRSEVSALPLTEMIKTLMQNPVLAGKVYFKILYLNLKAECTLIDSEQHWELLKWTSKTNEYYFLIHILMLILIPVMLFLKRREKYFVSYVFLLLIPLLVIIASSGINYWQGDRYTLPALPIWLVLYTFVLLKLISHLQTIMRKN